MEPWCVVSHESMKGSAHAEFGESAFTGWVLSQLMLRAQRLRARFACAARAANDALHCAVPFLPHRTFVFIVSGQPLRESPWTQ
jgi:hypothetical protein